MFQYVRNLWAVFQASGNRRWLVVGAVVVLMCLVAWVVQHNNSPQIESGITITTQADTSADRTLQLRGNVAVIDFSKCKPDVRRYFGGLGSTTIEIKGLSDGSCLMNYGGELGNPQWDGKLSFRCHIPPVFAEQEFDISSDGVDLSTLERYCE